MVELVYFARELCHNLRAVVSREGCIYAAGEYGCTEGNSRNYLLPAHTYFTVCSTNIEMKLYYYYDALSNLALDPSQAKIEDQLFCVLDFTYDAYSI